MDFYEYIDEFHRCKRIVNQRGIDDLTKTFLLLPTLERVVDAADFEASDLMRHIKRNFGDATSFYHAWINSVAHTVSVEHGISDPFTPALGLSELLWVRNERPYYNLWPSIIPALRKLDIGKAESTHFRLPMNQLLLRFPVQNNPFTWKEQGMEWQVRSVLCENTMLRRSGVSMPQPASLSITKSKRNGIDSISEKDLRDFNGAESIVEPSDVDNGDVVRGIALWVDIAEPVSAVRNMVEGIPVRPATVLEPTAKTYRHFHCESGLTIEQSLSQQVHHASAAFGLTLPLDYTLDLFKVVATLCLFDEDPEIVEPIVLAKDREKYAKTGDRKYVEKAIRNHRFGFDVGRRIEVSPHLRAASPAALYWTGPGRKVPRIRFRKGCVVKRNKLAEVPTGYLDRESVDE